MVRIYGLDAHVYNAICIVLGNDWVSYKADEGDVYYIEVKDDVVGIKFQFGELNIIDGNKTVTLDSLNFEQIVIS